MADEPVAVLLPANADLVDLVGSGTCGRRGIFDRSVWLAAVPDLPLAPFPLAPPLEEELVLPLLLPILNFFHCATDNSLNPTAGPSTIPDEEP